MNDLFIKNYLLEKHILTEQQLEKALHIQQASNIRLGLLSINQGVLNIEQVILINQQQRLFNKKFGDIAIANNLLSPSQVEQLLTIQKKQRKLLGPILLEEGLISEIILNEALLAQRIDQEVLSQSLDEIANANALEKTAKDSLSSIENLFLRCLHSHFKVNKIVTNLNSINTREQIASIVICGTDSRLCVAIAIDNTTLMAICARFIGIPHNECDVDLAKDALGEFLNCIAGYIIGDVIPMELSVTPSQPFFVETSDQLINEYANVVAVEFSSEVGSGNIIIARP